MTVWDAWECVLQIETFCDISSQIKTFCGIFITCDSFSAFSADYNMKKWPPPAVFAHLWRSPIMHAKSIKRHCFVS